MSDSQITKRAIAQALKGLCRTKPFDKISVSDITQACGLNRQSFYYHFQDKYELLNWVYYHDAFAPVVDGISFENWDQRILGLLKRMQEEKRFYENTIQSQGRNFSDYLVGITQTLFNDAAEKLDVGGRLSEESKSFFAQFNAFGICGVVVTWAQGGMKTPPEEVASSLKGLVFSSERLAAQRSRETGLAQESPNVL